MNKSRLLTEQTKNNHVSRLIKAIDLSFEADNATLPKETQFGFRAILQTNQVVLENSSPYNIDGFDMEFDVPFDDDMIANEAEFTLYNLTETTANKFKSGEIITLKAGYGDDVGVIFEGYISKVSTKRKDVDKVTTIHALDDVKYTPQMMEETTYSQGVTAQTILENLLNKLGLEIAVFKPIRNHTYDSETKIEGSIVENIKKYSEVCGISTYIHKQKIYSRSLQEGDNLDFTVNSDTGMIGSPSPYEEEKTYEKYVDKKTGFDIEMILQHRMSTAGIVKVDSMYYQGEYRIVSGKHKYDGLSAKTEIKCLDTVKSSVKEEKK